MLQFGELFRLLFSENLVDKQPQKQKDQGQQHERRCHMVGKDGIDGFLK
jgi:hypothetical protein